MTNNFYRKVTEKDFKDSYAGVEPGLSPDDENWVARINEKAREINRLTDDDTHAYNLIADKYFSKSKSQEAEIEKLKLENLRLRVALEWIEDSCFVTLNGYDQDKTVALEGIESVAKQAME